MDTNMALAGLASGRAVLVGAACGRGVHDTPPGYAWQHCHEKYVWTPVCFTTAPHHGLLQSYHLDFIRRKHFMLNAIPLILAALMAVGIIVIGCFYLVSPERISGTFGLKPPASDAD